MVMKEWDALQESVKRGLPLDKKALERIIKLLENPKVRAGITKAIKNSPIGKGMKEILQNVDKEAKEVANSTAVKNIEQEVVDEAKTVENSSETKNIEQEVSKEVKAIENNPTVKKIEQAFTNDADDMSTMMEA